MSRILKVAAAQLGPVHLTSKREETVQRMIRLLESAASQGVRLVLFPELAFVTFFPRHLITDPVELDSFFEHEDDITSSPHMKPLFEKAKELVVDISVGYAERTSDGRGFNTSIYYSATRGQILSKYRKVHLPGTIEPFPSPDAINQLEKRYFTPGDLGFQAFRAPGLIPSAAKEGDGVAAVSAETGDRKGDVILGMLICNDRRWPEAWRCLGLQGVELVLCGYNTVAWAPELWGHVPSDTTSSSDPGCSAAAAAGSTAPAPAPAPTPSALTTATTTALTQHKLVMQSNSYTNSCFSISAAKAGLEDGTHGLIGGSCITDPQGRIVAEATGEEEEGDEDELVIAEVDLAECESGRRSVFDFGRHRRVEHYGRIVEQTGVVEPELLVG